MFRMKNQKKMKSIGLAYSSLFTLLLTMVFSVSMATYTFNPPTEANTEVEEAVVNTFPFEDDKLLAFFDSNREISSLQRESQEKMQETLKKYNLTPERFGQIGRASQIGALSGGTFTQEEIDAFNNAAPQVTVIQKEQQSMMQALLAEKGLSTQLYQEIMNEFRKSKDLQAYVSNLARERAIDIVKEERRVQRELEAQQEDPEKKE